MERCRVAFCVGVMMAACAGPGAPLVNAQEGVALPAPDQLEGPTNDTWGGSSTTNHVLQAFAFVPRSAADGAFFSANNFGSRYCTSPCNFAAPLMLPAGAVIVAMRLEACDTDPAGQVNVNLIRQPSFEQPFTNLGAVGTGLSPGCSTFSVNINPLHTVDNATGTYFLTGDVFGNSENTRFQSVRIVYRLQVSPGPATATFPNDVPTSHPFFRFVEALAAAGITGGCAPGSYCPFAPITRGEMAVFMATALGLHFPN